MMASKDNRVGYEMEIITYPGRGIEKVEGIRGKKMAFTFETSNSGYEAPSALLRDQFKMEAGKDYKPAFSSAWRRIGMLFEEFALVERSTLMENLLSGRLGYTGFWRACSAASARAFELLGRVGLAGTEYKRTDALSGGQRTQAPCRESAFVYRIGTGRAELKVETGTYLRVSTSTYQCYCGYLLVAPRPEDGHVKCQKAVCGQ
jgi:hypothetical protein